jgi:hypothetical protein
VLRAHLYTCIGGGEYIKNPLEKYNNRKTNTYLILFSLTHYTLNENYGGLYRKPHGESKVAAIDKELMLRLRTPTVLMCLVFYLLDLAVYNF